jgi:hypothetical protein
LKVVEMVSPAVVTENVMVMKILIHVLKIVKTKATVKKLGMEMPAAWMSTVYM